MDQGDLHGGVGALQQPRVEVGDARQVRVRRLDEDGDGDRAVPGPRLRLQLRQTVHGALRHERDGVGRQLADVAAEGFDLERQAGWVGTAEDGAVEGLLAHLPPRALEPVAELAASAGARRSHADGRRAGCASATLPPALRPGAGVRLDLSHIIATVIIATVIIATIVFVFVVKGAFVKLRKLGLDIGHVVLADLDLPFSLLQ